MDKKQKSMLTTSVKRHIRQEKARIRREFLSIKEQDEQISKLYGKFEHMTLSSGRPKIDGKKKLEKTEKTTKNKLKTKPRQKINQQKTTRKKITK